MAGATIASGQSLSGIVDLGGHALVAIRMPAAWTAAVLTFQASDDDDDAFTDVYAADGIEVTAQAAASRWIAIAPPDFVSARYLKVRSGTAAAPVNQAAERVLRLVTVRV